MCATTQHLVAVDGDNVAQTNLAFLLEDKVVYLDNNIKNTNKEAHNIRKCVREGRGLEVCERGERSRSV